MLYLEGQRLSDGRHRRLSEERGEARSHSAWVEGEGDEVEQG